MSRRDSGLRPARKRRRILAVNADPLSAMTPRFNLFFRGFARRYFRHLGLDEETVRRLRALEEQGSVVYVMRYASRLDYFLFNALFVRHGLRLSGFANGIRFYYYRPLWEALRLRLTRRFRAARRRTQIRGGTEAVRGLTRSGQSCFLFLRTARLRTWLRGRRSMIEEERADLDLLAQTVRTAGADRPVFLVPLALFWRKGPRTQRRFLNLAYGAPTRPSDLAKVLGFLATYRDLFVKVGEPIDLRRFVSERHAEGEDALTRKLRRVILVFLYREEKVVEGPTLRPRHQVQETVLLDAGVQGAIAARARESGRSPEKARLEAEKMFHEIAAHMNSTFLAIVNGIVTRIFRRMFASIEPIGIEKVAEYAKRHPIVLVPSHRSYFDFLILSWLFYAHHLVPPHIAARENMAFGPFGFLFRRLGAFFLRRSFDDPLYKEVFRAYVAYLLKEGFTQEFFIEGGRSRTGRSLAPRLGMLTWHVEAFLGGSHRDLFFVPIAITYERLVEEGAMVKELEGGGKRDESTFGLLRARKVLGRRWGSAVVSFGEPISLAATLGEARARLAASQTAGADAEKRQTIEALGHRLVERINWATVANATSVVACALLGESRRGLLRHDLVRRIQELVDLLRLQDVKFTPALLRDEGDFRESIGFLLRSDLVQSRDDPRGEILYFEESNRRALDLYRNTILHFLAVPSFLARRLLPGTSVEDLRQDLRFWVDLLYEEFFVPRGLVFAAKFDAFLDYFERLGVIERQDGVLLATEKGWPYLRFLAEQTRSVLEAYYALFSAVLPDSEGSTRKQLQRAAQECFERGELLGEVARPEAASPATFANAIELLARRGILERRKPSDAREAVYVRGPHFDALPALRERLASTLVAR